MILLQSIYTLVASLRAIADIKSLMVISGCKTDFWLVKTVAALVIAISICLISGLFFRGNPLPILILSLTSAIALSTIDLYYLTNNTIGSVYLLDAVAHLIFTMISMILLMNAKRWRT
ncbi:hypothetical protein [Pollutibacter soli]|uniref:hypothetical protein n=1 Tax=Pollutibacter soli TaxID=3034157 RepID=UPI003013A5AD